MCVIAVVGAAPCQCRSLGGIHTTSPGRISAAGSPSVCTRPTPDERLAERVVPRRARAGLGMTIVYEDQVRDEIARGELVPVLEAFCEPFPGYYLFYPQRRHASPALRALIDFLRASRKTSRVRKRRR
jgi:hypothetical protein